ALKQAGPRVSIALRGGSRTSTDSWERHRARDLLVIAQVTLAMVLLVSSGLMIRTVQMLRTVEPGFTRADHIHPLRTSIPPRMSRTRSPNLTAGRVAKTKSPPTSRLRVL